MAKSAGAAAEASPAGAGYGKIDLLANIVLLGGGGVAAIATTALIPALPLIEKSFAAEPDAAFLTKLLISAAAGAAIVGGLAAGPLVDRFGRWKVLLGGHLLFLLAGIAGLWLPSLWTLIASRVVAGAAGALAGIVGFTLIGDLSVGLARERRIGLSYGLSALVVGVAIPLGGYLADINWRLVFLLHLISAPVLACVYFSKSLRGADAWIAAQVRERSAQARGGIPRAVIPLVALSLVIGVIMYTTQIYLPFRLRDLGLYSGKLAGGLYSVGLLTAMVTALVYGEVRRRLSAMAIFVVVFLGGAVGIFGLALAANTFAIAAAMVVFSLAAGLSSPNLVSAVTAVTDEESRPRSMGLVKAVNVGGPMLGPALLQVVYATYGAVGAYYALAGISAVLFVICSAAAAFKGFRAQPQAA